MPYKAVTRNADILASSLNDNPDDIFKDVSAPKKEVTQNVSDSALMDRIESILASNDLNQLRALRNEMVAYKESMSKNVTQNESTMRM